MDKKVKILASVSAIILIIAFILPILSSCTNKTTDENNEEDTKNTDGEVQESLPEIHITTPKGKPITDKENYSKANVRFTLNGIYKEYENTYTDSDGGNAELRCRGNSSYSAGSYTGKYSYKMKLESKEDLFGMGKSRHWYLVANWFDVTHMRNKLAYDLSGALGMSYTASTWVVLYFNGAYMGIYSLVESIRIDKGRVETFDWDEFAEDIAHMASSAYELDDQDAEMLESQMKDDFSWMNTGEFRLLYTKTVYDDNGQLLRPKVDKTFDLSAFFEKDSLDYTSGYLIEYDGRLDSQNEKWRTEHNIPVMIDAPDAIGTNPNMLSYVKELIADFEEALYSDDFHNSKGKHYSHYLDVDSLVEFWTIWNLFNNIEFGYLSLYYYIDNGKIVFGPCWDFDNASGNLVTLNSNWMRYNYWVHDRGGTSTTPGWFTTIMKDPYFVALCQEKWFSIREAVDEMMRSINIYDKYIRSEALKCYETNGERSNWYLTGVNGGHSYDYPTDLENLINWLTNRINWIDTNFSVCAPNIDGCGFSRSSQINTQLSIGSSTLASDSVTVYGAKADYIVPSDLGSDINLCITTSHPSAASIKVYLNGSTYIGGGEFNDSTPINLHIKKEDLDLESGTINVIYIIVYNQRGYVRAVSSVNLRAYKDELPKKDQYVVVCGDKILYIDKGASLALPEITESKEGFTAVGWTTGKDSCYSGGSYYTPEQNTYFYIRWKRNALDSFMILD